MKLATQPLRLAIALLALATAPSPAAALTADAPGACWCGDAASPKAFKRCVRKALATMTARERASDPARTLRRLAARASCGRETLPRGAAACCLPFAAAGNIVTGRMCAAVTAPQCAKLGGVAFGGGTACAPTPCGLAVDIPVAHTPPGGYGANFPAPILAGCTEPLVAGAPDVRGMWQAVSVEVNGAPAPSDHPGYRHFQRIEQCGNRLVVTAGGVVHDMRCDGTVEHGVHDVAEFDFKTAITVVATYESGVHTLRPVGFPGIQVTRRLDGDMLVWSYLGSTLRLRRIGGPESPPPAP